MGGSGEGELPPGTIDAVGVGAGALVEPGALVGRYVVEQEIGRGAMGVVYRAYDPDVDRRIALKVLHELVDDSQGAHALAPSRRARLIREAQAMARLSHPNIVRVHDAGVARARGAAGALVYIAMDLVEGTTLRGWGAADRPLADVLAVFVAAGRGLAAAHAAGLVHRDFKPDNVLLDERGHVFVGDFGLVRLVDAAAPRAHPRSIIAVDEPDAEASRMGAVVGTPAYMAPEQLAGAEVDDRADQFAFCVALWEAVYGARPFAGTSIDRLVSAVMRHELAPVPAGRHVPAWLRKLLLRGIQAHPGDRFASMDALLDALSSRPARRRTLAWLAGIGTAGIVAVTVGAWTRGRPCPTAAVRSWNEDSRAELDIAAGRWIAGDAVVPTIARGIDEWSARWAGAYADNCAASLVHGERSTAAWASARACLERQDDEAGRLLAAIAMGRVTTGAQAVLAVHALADPTGCAVAGGDMVPVDPRLAVAIGSADDFVADATVEVKRAVERATSIAAEPELHAAVLAVEPLRSDRLAAHAWVRLVSIAARDPARATESAHVATLAHAAVERGGDDARLHADIDDARARGLLAADRPQEAIDHALSSLAAREQALGPRHPDVAASWLLLGRIDAARGERDRALADDVHALAIVEDLFGARHPIAAAVALHVADDLDALDMTDEAMRWRARGLAVLMPGSDGSR